MLDRLAVGDIPAKHHIVHRDGDGGLLWEHCLTRKGFDGGYTIAYRQRRPHLAFAVEAQHGWTGAEPVRDLPLARRHFRSADLQEGGTVVDDTVPIVASDDLVLGIAKPTAADPVYTKIADGDLLVYVHEGTGTLRTELGDVRYTAKDYVCVPKGLIHRWIPDDGVSQHLLTMLCLGGVGLLDKWRNPLGQLRMDAPYCHRDFTRPTFTGPVDEGIRDVVVRREGAWHGLRYDDSPLDVVGWDGTVYPWVFPILAFQPRAGLVHLPPDWHGTFAARGALICSFVPRVVDFHDQAIPCPYPHSSVDCDEFLFYCEGNFTSRKGVGPGSISLHPYGIPHGPHPGAYEGSLGTERTDELAVMIDTFKPMWPTEAALGIEDAHYHDSFRD